MGRMILETTVKFCHKITILSSNKQNILTRSELGLQPFQSLRSFVNDSQNAMLDTPRTTAPNARPHVSDLPHPHNLPNLGLHLTVGLYIGLYILYTGLYALMWKNEVDTYEHRIVCLLPEMGFCRSYVAVPHSREDGNCRLLTITYLKVGCLLRNNHAHQCLDDYAHYSHSLVYSAMYGLGVHQDLWQCGRVHNVPHVMRCGCSWHG